MCSSDQIERRMTMYKDEVGGVLSLGDLEDEDGNGDKNEQGGEGRYNNGAVNGEKCDKNRQKEVGNNHVREET